MSLFKAAKKGDLEFIKNYTGDFNERYVDNFYYDNNQTALIFSVKNNHKDVVEFLLDKIDVNIEDDYGLTALHFAAMYNFKDIVQLLLKKADANIIDSDHETTPLIEAAARNFKYIVKILLPYTNVNIGYFYGVVENDIMQIIEPYLNDLENHKTDPLILKYFPDYLSNIINQF